MRANQYAEVLKLEHLFNRSDYIRYKEFTISQHLTPTLDNPAPSFRTLPTNPSALTPAKLVYETASWILVYFV